MCDCTSCEYTDGFRTQGFAAWPKGDPAGKRSSEAAYRAHVAHARSGAYGSVRFTPGQAPVFSTAGLNMPIPQAPKLVLDWIARSYAWAPKASVTRIKQAPRLVQLARDLRKAA